MIPASAMVSGPHICGFPGLALWLKGTAIPFGAVMEFAVDRNGVVRAPSLAASLGPRPRPRCHPLSPAHPLRRMQVCKLPPPTYYDLAAAASHFLCRDQLDTEGARQEVLDEVIKNSVGKKREVP